MGMPMGMQPTFGMHPVMGMQPVGMMGAQTLGFPPMTVMPGMGMPMMPGMPMMAGMNMPMTPAMAMHAMMGSGVARSRVRHRK